MAEGRKKCPTDEMGVPLVPLDFDVCYEECESPQVNKHHLLHPRVEYRGFPDRHAREAGNMVVRACVCKHKEYHATYLPPAKPSRQTLVDIAQGDIEPQVAEVYIRRRNG